MLQPGIHHGVTMQDYLLHPGLSASRINTLLAYSPFHARHMESDGPTEASEIGTAIHDALLEGVDRLVECPFDDWRKGEAREMRDAARKEGKIPVLSRKLPQIYNAVDAAKRYIASSEIADVLERGRPEVTLIWDEDGLTCKARPDWLTDERDVILHLKTTQGSAEPSAWIRNQLVPMGYDVAAMFYERGLYAAEDGSGKDAPLSVFLVIEQEPPHGCSLIGLAPAMQDLAARKVDRAIRAWQKCKATGVYPCYPSRIAYAEPMPWQVAGEEEKELNTAFDELQEKEGIQP